MFDIICVTNRRLCEGDFFEKFEKIAASGVKAIILREKDLSEREYFCLAEKFTGICSKYKIEAVLHTYVDAAISLKVRSIHLPLDILRKTDDKKKSFFNNIGVSCHSVADAIEAENAGASYITFGHVFATDCKKNLAPRGLDALKNVCEAVRIPVFAIGGINAENVEYVWKNGASGICVMSGFMKCDDPGIFVKNLKANVENV